MYKRGILRKDNTLILYDTTYHSAPVLTSSFLKDVTVKIGDNGILSVKGNEIQFDFYGSEYWGRIFEDEWQRTPDDSEIQEGKRHFWSKKKERFVRHGWVMTKETRPVEFILKDFSIEIYE